MAPTVSLAKSRTWTSTPHDALAATQGQLPRPSAAMCVENMARTQQPSLRCANAAMPLWALRYQAISVPLRYPARNAGEHASSSIPLAMGTMANAETLSASSPRVLNLFRVQSAGTEHLRLLWGFNIQVRRTYFKNQTLAGSNRRTCSAGLRSLPDARSAGICSKSTKRNAPERMRELREGRVGQGAMANEDGWKH